MLARLSSSDYPALSKLKTRDDDDFTVAFLDATAIVLDVLTFYQERLANESYLRTATQLRSLTELSRLISYAPAPGVSASVYLAFTLKTTPGLPPDPSAAAITIPQGSQVQSVPAQGQTPQTFETSADIQAKPDWNALPVMASIPWQPSQSSVYLEGTSTQLQPGDSLLILGVEREKTNGSSSEQWDVVVLNEVQVDNVHKRTYLAWDEPLDHELQPSSPSWTAAKIFAFRQKAALFGHNAPDPNLFVDNNASPPKPSLPNNLIVTTTTPWTWNYFDYTLGGQLGDNQIDLDAIYRKIVIGSWLVLAEANPSGDQPPSYTVQLYQVKSATTASRAMFTISGQVTELTVDQTIGGLDDLRSAEVWGQSEQLIVAEQPLTYPLYGGMLDLQDRRADLTGAQALAISGKRQKLAVLDGVTTLSFTPTGGSPVSLKPGDVLTLADSSSLPLDPNSPVPDWNSQLTEGLTLNVEDASGRTGTVTIPGVHFGFGNFGGGGIRSFTRFHIGIRIIPNTLSNYFELAPSDDNDLEVSEIVTVTQVIADTTAADADTSAYPHTQFQLNNPLAYCYDRSTTTVNANVGLATHGQSVSEILGSGSASTPNQTFTLKQSPLTYVQNSTAENGRQSTLQVQVNSVQWQGLPSLYNQSPSAQVFATANQADGTTDVIFGDGVEGALLPTGQNNLRANYRIGSGSQGNVAPGKLTTLMDRPLGVSGVTNPEDASGGQDAESPDDIRSNAPQTVLTLGRAVSIADYQNFASTYAGIAKAYAVWISMGPGLGVYLTVAGVDGAAVDNITISSLVAALRNFGNPLIPITVASYANTSFTFSASIQYDPSYDQPTVQGQVLQAVQNAFSFEARSFGQPVSTDEIAAVIQNVPGVIAVNVAGLRALTSTPGNVVAGLSQNVGRFRILPFSRFLYRRFAINSGSTQRLCASLPVADPQSQPSPAEILVLDPNFSAASFSVMS